MKVNCHSDALVGMLIHAAPRSELTRSGLQGVSRTLTNSVTAIVKVVENREAGRQQGRDEFVRAIFTPDGEVKDTYSGPDKNRLYSRQSD
jgi:hypothetical protein